MGLSRRSLLKWLGIAPAVPVAVNLLPVEAQEYGWAEVTSEAVTYDLDLTEMVHTTLRAQAGDLADNVMATNDLYARLKARKPMDIRAEHIVRPVLPFESTPESS